MWYLSKSRWVYVIIFSETLIHMIWLVLTLALWHRFTLTLLKWIHGSQSRGSISPPFMSLSDEAIDINDKIGSRPSLPPPFFFRRIIMNNWTITWSSRCSSSGWSSHLGQEILGYFRQTNWTDLYKIPAKIELSMKQKIIFER